MHKRKILLIRFSSLGDVVQTLSVVTQLASWDCTLTDEKNPVHWITREEYAPLISRHPDLEQTWSLDRTTGIKGLFSLALNLRKQKYTHIYDAHNNLRSRLISFILCFPAFGLGNVTLLRKSQKRLKRFLLFKFRMNLYQMPFSGQKDLLEPLKKWSPDLFKIPPAPQIFPDVSILSKMKDLFNFHFVALAPSAAHPLKRWPLENWKNLIAMNPNIKFVVFGGAKDFFLEDLKASNVILKYQNFSLSETLATVSLAKLLISNDTGVMHFGEQLGLPTIALMGPAPFGFPSRNQTMVLEKNLQCRPCSKHGQGPCVNPEYQKCLKDISASEVSSFMQQLLKES